MTCIMALDQGTSSSRAILFDLSGKIISSAQREFTQHYPKPGWVEHDADEIWTTQCETALEALKKSGLEAGDVAAIGITNQRETLVTWDRKSGKPLHRAIVWQDRRTSGVISEMKEEETAKIITEKTGLPFDPYFSGSKIKWLLDRHPEIKGGVERKEVCFGTVDSWLVYKLTHGKKFVTDVSNASRTLLMDIDAICWDGELMRFFGVSEDNLPEILPSNGHFGETDLLGRPLPICGIAGDQQSALFGQLCFDAGEVKNTFGTGCFILSNTGGRRIHSQNKLLSTVAWQLNGEPVEYALEGSVFIGGAAVQWLRDGLGLISAAPDINTLAAGVEDTGGVYLVPAFTGLGAPYWNPEARGTITGITRGTTAAHIARATLESIALQSAEVIQAMAEDLGGEIPQIKVDGGASASDLLMSMQADFTGCEVIRPGILETTALGAALLAGLGKGLFSSKEELAKAVKDQTSFSPNLKKEKREQKIREWRKAVDASLFIASHSS